MNFLQALGLSTFYWSNIRKDTLLWVLLGIGFSLSFLPTADIVSNLISDKLALNFPLVVARYTLPALGFVLAMQWFCWASEIDFMSPQSCLPNYFCTLPVSTALLAMLPMFGGIIIVMGAWLPWQTQELGLHRINLSVVSAATFIWLQVTLWQPMPIRGMRIPLVLIIGLIFLTTVFSWTSNEWRLYTEMQPVPIFGVISYGLLGVVLVFWSTVQARQNNDSAWQIKVRLPWQLNQRKHFKSASQAHRHYEGKLHRYSLALVFSVMAFIPIPIFFTPDQSLYFPDTEFYKWTFYILFLAPLCIVFISGLDRGNLAVGKNFSTRQTFSPYFSTLPFHSFDY